MWKGMENSVMRYFYCITIPVRIGQNKQIRLQNIAALKSYHPQLIHQT